MLIFYLEILLVTKMNLLKKNKKYLRYNIMSLKYHHTTWNIMIFIMDLKTSH